MTSSWYTNETVRTDEMEIICKSYLYRSEKLKWDQHINAKILHQAMWTIICISNEYLCLENNNALYVVPINKHCEIKDPVNHHNGKRHPWYALSPFT